jgi:uncharacterized membrane protein
MYSNNIRIQHPNGPVYETVKKNYILILTIWSDVKQLIFSQKSLENYRPQGSKVEWYNRMLPSDML